MARMAKDRLSATICVVTVLYALAFAVSGPSLAIVTKRLVAHASDAAFAWQYGVVSAIHPVCKAVGAPLIGRLSGNHTHTHTHQRGTHTPPRAQSPLGVPALCVLRVLHCCVSVRCFVCVFVPVCVFETEREHVCVSVYVCISVSV